MDRKSKLQRLKKIAAGEMRISELGPQRITIQRHIFSRNEKGELVTHIEERTVITEWNHQQ